PPHDNHGGRRGNRVAAALAARVRLFGNAGLSVQRGEARRGSQEAVRAPLRSNRSGTRGRPEAASGPKIRLSSYLDTRTGQTSRNLDSATSVPRLSLSALVPCLSSARPPSAARDAHPH